MSRFLLIFQILMYVSFAIGVSSCQKKCTGYFLHEDDECVAWSSRWQGECEVLGHTSDTALVGTYIQIYEGSEPDEVWFGDVGIGILGTLADENTLNLDTNGYSSTALLSYQNFGDISTIEVSFVIENPSSSGQVSLGRAY